MNGEERGWKIVASTGYEDQEVIYAVSSGYFEIVV